MDDLITKPNPERAHRQSAALQAQLRASLSYLAGEAAKAEILDLAQFGDWMDRMIGQRLSPACFGAYYDLIAAMEKGQKRRAAVLFGEITETPVCGTTISIRRLGDDYTAGETRRIRKFMGGAGTGASGVRRPNHRKVARFETVLRDALDWIERRAPELAAEIDASIREIILVGPDRSGREAFEGGTSFKLTGALVLNAERDVDVADLVVTLAHEAGHAILFGECCDEMLVENPDTERHWSPIREERRPLEGIFHAGFVSSRMLWVLDRMEEDPQFSLHEQITMTTARADASQVFAECVSIVGQKARLTATGTRIFGQMRKTQSARDLANRTLRAVS
ncbi:MAG: HEXXH motif-containing putative peptide modification protein [Pseudomonadota bacterium]